MQTLYWEQGWVPAPTTATTVLKKRFRAKSPNHSVCVDFCDVTNATLAESTLPGDVPGPEIKGDDGAGLPGAGIRPYEPAPARFWPTTIFICFYHNRGGQRAGRGSRWHKGTSEVCPRLMPHECATLGADDLADVIK